MNKRITAADIKNRHPRYLTCETDQDYAELASDIYDMLYPDLSFMEDIQVRNACISLALYFEDLRSDTLQFKTFTHLYHEMFGCYVPFHASADEKSPNAEIDAMKFVLWLCITAERDGKLLNPTNTALAESAKQLLEFWKKRETSMPANEELADYLFSEETQEDANEVKLILAWIARSGFLGRWYTHRGLAEDKRGLRRLMPKLDAENLEYFDLSLAAFEERAWPLSLSPQRIYAEMIRQDMEDPNDPYAAKIEKMKSKPLDIYQIAGCDNSVVNLLTDDGELFSVVSKDFMTDIRRMAGKYSHVMGAFTSLDGLWRVNGPSLWITPKQKDLDRHAELRRLYNPKNTDVDPNAAYIENHGGERLYFFPNLEEYAIWLEDDLHYDKANIPQGNFGHKKEPIMAFLEHNGRAGASNVAVFVKHPNNPFYDKYKAEHEGIAMFAERASCTSDALMYIIKRGLLPDVMLNDIRGREHGLELTQENIEFLARCIRRDITLDYSVHHRTTQPEDAEDDTFDKSFYLSKVSFDEFLSRIKSEKSIRSKANKEWRVVKTDELKTTIRDVRTKENYTIPTRELYEAHLALNADDIQIASVTPFVGKENASAASALLYNIVGRGQSMNALRKIAREFFQKRNLPF